MDTYLLDTNAVLTYLGRESGVEKIRAILVRAEISDCLLYIHAVNLYEVYYQFYRDKGETAAQELWTDIHALPLVILYTLNEEFIKVAGRIKADFKMSVADSFLLAQAHLLNAEVVTSDHHEFNVVDQAGLVKFYWYR